VVAAKDSMYVALDPLPENKGLIVLPSDANAEKAYWSGVVLASGVEWANKGDVAIVCPYAGTGISSPGFAKGADLVLAFSPETIGIVFGILDMQNNRFKPSGKRVLIAKKPAEEKSNGLYLTLGAKTTDSLYIVLEVAEDCDEDFKEMFQPGVSENGKPVYQIGVGLSEIADGAACIPCDDEFKAAYNAQGLDLYLVPASKIIGKYLG
jgi:co-chaperonin GroES (HSP10)